MWELALHMEEGGLDRTARALEQARQAAQDALQKAMQNPTDTNRQALEQRLRELEQAIQNRMQALMDQLRRNGQKLPPNADAAAPEQPGHAATCRAGPRSRPSGSDAGRAAADGGA